MAESGSVLFMYDRKGKVEVPAVLDEEALLGAAIEAGCEDMDLKEVSSRKLVVVAAGQVRECVLIGIWASVETESCVRV